MTSIPIPLLCVALAAILTSISISYPSVRKIIRATRTRDSESGTAGMEFPSLSVIVYDFADDETLERYLGQISAQTYPDYKVIIVSDADSVKAREMRERFGEKFPDVHFTFIPPGSHNLSRRKLAFTIGIKAASTEFVLTTVSTCSISSPEWLATMMRPVIENPAVNIVLGLSCPDAASLKGISKWFRQFDFCFRTSQWVAGALNSRPFRGDGFNMLFARSLFFGTKGYSKTTHIDPGDDDLFLSEIATGTNTAVQLDKNAILTQNPANANKSAVEMRERYAFSAKMLPRQPFIKAGIGSCCQWIALISTICAALSPLFTESAPDPVERWTPAVIASALLLIFWGFGIYLYRLVAPCLNTTRLWWSVPVFMLWRPIDNFFFGIRHRSRLERFYTRNR